MKIAIISDIHDNAHNLVLALKEIENSGAEQILSLGDFTSTGVAKILNLSKVPVFAIWGNNDGDKMSIIKNAPSIVFSEATHDKIELGDKKIFISHYPDVAKSMAKSGDFDAVFYGHNHIKNKDRIGDCLVVNPGEIGAVKTKTSTFAIYDTEKNDAEIYEVKGFINIRTKEVEEYLGEIANNFNANKKHQY